jgi:hypothetical protein
MMNADELMETPRCAQEEAFTVMPQYQLSVLRTMSGWREAAVFSRRTFL